MMPVQRNPGETPDQKAMLRFLRQLLRGPVFAADVSGAPCKAWQGVPGVPDVAAQAVSLGLAMLQQDRLVATPEAAAFVRRVLTGSTEDGFSSQHRDLVHEDRLIEGKRQAVRRNLAESPLSSLARLKDRDGSPFIPQEAVDAGERLARDFERAGLQPKITASWEPRIATRTKGERGGMAELADTALAARDRVAEAVGAMGPELSGVALDICCFGKGLELVERERGWPVRSGKLMLRTALLVLARHYAPPATQRRRRLVWGAEGYRPDLAL